ncbi:hypothetical protein DOLIC_00058 [Dolichomitus sp. PSUC_FEM 10030005]|nr:hypothetical protein [Dolichomitus sp. PSUC_FEM 10030005]
MDNLDPIAETYSVEWSTLLNAIAQDMEGGADISSTAAADFQSILHDLGLTSAQGEKEIIASIDKDTCPTIDFPDDISDIINRDTMQSIESNHSPYIKTIATQWDTILASVTPPPPPTEECIDDTQINNDEASLGESIVDKILTSKPFEILPNLINSIVVQQYSTQNAYPCHSSVAICKFYESKILNVETNWRAPLMLASARDLLCTRTHTVFAIDVKDPRQNLLSVVGNVCAFTQTLDSPKIIKHTQLSLQNMNYDPENPERFEDCWLHTKQSLNNECAPTIIIIADKEIDCVIMAEQVNQHKADYHVKLLPRQPVVISENTAKLMLLNLEQTQQNNTNYWTSFYIANKSSESVNIDVFVIDSPVMGFRPTFIENCAKLLLPTLMDEFLFLAKSYTGTMVFPLYTEAPYLNPINLMIYQLALCHAASHIISYSTSTENHQMSYNNIFASPITIPEKTTNVFLCSNKI